MAIDPSDFEEIAKRFDKMSPEEREDLLDRLEERRAVVDRGNGAGPSLFDAMNERGMAGSIKNAPPDWSTNPKYLEGLGQDVE